jgi:hypothetical protein
MEPEVKKEGDFSIKSKSKAKPKKKNDDPIVKVDMGKPPAAAIEEAPTKVVIKDEEKPVDVNKEIDKSTEDALTPIKEIIEDTSKEPEKPVTPKVVDSPTVELPENIEKLVEFMKETDGTIEDYVRLNSDYTNVDESTLIKEYYKQTKPYLDADDIELFLEDFDYDEDIDEEKDIRKKKIAFKQEVGKAKEFLEQTKKKYYSEIKMKRGGLTDEQKKATEFFDRYNKDQSLAEQQHAKFENATKDLFNNNFEGFEFKIGEKKFNYGVQNKAKVADDQSNLNNLIGKFLNESGEISDHKSYHKAIYAASNIDTIASHFYEQGKADSLREVMEKSKNIKHDVRTNPQDVGFVNGLKVTNMSASNNSSKLKIKKVKIS